MTSTESETDSSRVVDGSYSESVEGTNSSDGIRGVWYYLTSSMDSSEASLSTTMPLSSTATSSYSESWTTASSLSVIEISSSVEDDETARSPASRDSRQKQEIITISDSSSSETDFDGSEKQLSADGSLDESNLMGSDGKYQTSGSSSKEEAQHNEAERGSGEDFQEAKQVDFKSKAEKSGDDESRGVTFIFNLTHWSTVVDLSGSITACERFL